MKLPKSDLVLASLAIAIALLSGCAKRSTTADQDLTRKDDASRVKTESVERKRNPDIAVPLTRSLLVFVPGNPGQNTVDRIVTLDGKGQTNGVAQSDKIVFNIANSGGRMYGVSRLSLKGFGDDLIERVNKNRERLLDDAAGTFCNKTVEEFDRPGFRNVLRSELLSHFNQILGEDCVSEVIILDLATQWSN